MLHYFFPTLSKPCYFNFSEVLFIPKCPNEASAAKRKKGTTIKCIVVPFNNIE